MKILKLKWRIKRNGNLAKALQEQAQELEETPFLGDVVVEQGVVENKVVTAACRKAKTGQSRLKRGKANSSG